VAIAVIEAGVPMLVDARGLIDRFHAMIRKRPRAIWNRGSLTPAQA
jgi:hypothetical protein